MIWEVMEHSNSLSLRNSAISLGSLGLCGQAGGVCDFLVVFGPHKFGVGGHIAAFKVQGDDAIIIDIHDYLFRA